MIPKGYLYVICCACSFGFIPTLAKLTYIEGTSPELVFFFAFLPEVSLWEYGQDGLIGKN